MAEHHCRRGDTHAAGHENFLVLLGLVRGRAADEPHALVHSVDAVDVGLAELAAMGIGGQPPTHLERTALHIVSRLAEANPAPQTEQEYGNDYQLLVAVVMRP